MRSFLTRGAVCVGLMIHPSVAMAADSTNAAIRIGVITDMSGIYSDLSGPGTVAAIKMAVDDFGGKVLGRPIEVMVADSQNKADIASAKAREWIDTSNVSVLMDFMDSSVGLAIVGVAAEKNIPALVTGAASARFTNEDCTKVTVHYVWDTYAQANAVGSAITKDGHKKWFAVTVDNAFGKTLLSDLTETVQANGGQLVGSVKHPIGALDFSSFLLTAQNSGADVIGLAQGGRDAQAAIKTAAEFGVGQTAEQTLASFALFSTDVHAVGLRTMQKLYLVEPFYWDLNDETRAWSAKFAKVIGRPPTGIQAGNYSAALHYLRAVESAGTTDTDAVMRKMKELPINDMFAKNGRIREDGRMVHDMYLVQVKSPSESNGSWDLYHVRQTVPGDTAFQPLSKSRCPLVKK
ncbi:ABC transporter substrate-binding protein [Bradyrhizobium manausense]|uniref:ABC transporter substrate-binding protein n=1 Tax=Bradyrhizobium manausense TaxID=989370 RepID=UPI001BA9B368|nr:ABC transporter substrate-binding protein [Bradyrhizobium manausense]MBR0828599.1 ABC transporter substrate-binding protein [Bradyrhizobium manausense]